MRRLLARAALATWSWAVLVAVLDRRHGLSLDDVAPKPDGPLVSVIVPARDEERAVRRAVQSLAGQDYPNLEVIVVDDESSDATAAEARSVSSSRVRVLDGKPLPPGWVGKSWACHEGAREASGDWLLFTDADVIHAPDTVGRALALALREGRGGVTLFPLLETGTAAERVVQPAAAVLIRSFVAPGPLVRSARTPIAIAAGGFILVERSFYERAGGHEAIRGELVDDARLAERVKAAGGLLVPADSSGRVRVRMYEGAREVWRGWRKNTSIGLAGGSLPVAVAQAASGAVLTLAPALALARGPRGVGLAGLCAQMLARADVEPIVPTGRRWWPAFPVGALILALLSLVSSVDRVRGRLTWRGRTYE